MRFSVAGKVYSAAQLDDVSLRDILLFEQQTRDFGQAITWAEVDRWNEEIHALPTDAERQRHPGALWLTGITVWLSRRAAGEDVTFSEAVDVPASQIKMLPEPSDRKKASDPRKARPAKASGRAAARRAAEQDPALTSSTTSQEASTTD